MAYYYFWREIGTRMGIVDIPASYNAFEWWARSYERNNFKFAESNQRIGTATRDLFASWFPRIATPLVRYSIYAMLDDQMLASFGFPKPLPYTRGLLRGALKLRGRAVRWLPARREAHFFTDDTNRTHRDGYDIGRLGPPRLVAAEQRRRSISS